MRSEAKGFLSDRGMILPIVLFLIVALSAAAGSLLLLAGNEHRMGREAFRYLEARAGAERGLAGPPSASETELPLGSGFILRTTGAPFPGGPVRAAVYWRLDPDSVATSLPGALEVDRWTPMPGVGLLEEGCPETAGTASLIRESGSAISEGHPPDPPLPDPPRLGILGIASLMTLPALEVPTGGTLPGGNAPAIYRVPVGAEVGGEEGVGLLLAPGSLTLTAGARFRGLILAGGDLHILEEARVEGVALLGGGLLVEEGGSLQGCRGMAAEALGHPALARTHQVPGAGRLGRF